MCTVFQESHIILVGSYANSGSQRLDLKEILLIQQAVDVDIQSMCGQFRIKPGTQAPEGVSVIDLDLKQH